jgi:hypothetical protein
MFSTHEPTRGFEASADHAVPDTQNPAATEQASTAGNNIFFMVDPSLVTVRCEDRFGGSAQSLDRLQSFIPEYPR